MFKKILSVSLLASTTGAFAATCDTDCNPCGQPAKAVTCFTPRSQSFHNELKNAAMDPDNQFLYDTDCFNGSFNIMFEYNQTFNSDKLTQCLFGPAAACLGSISANNCNDDTMAIRVVGTKAATIPNGLTDLVADNFLLPKDFSSTITIKPSIQNFNIHLQAYFGFDEWCQGLYARVYAPIAVSRWKLEATETFGSRGTTPGGDYAAGEIAPAIVTNADLYDSFLAYTMGGANYSLPGITDDPVTLAGPTVEALKFTRFGSCETDTTTQLADLRAELGWNFVMDEDYHFGLYLAAAAPTAGDCEEDCNTFLWGAKAGNGKHWELGGGLTFHYTVCRSEDCENQVDFFVDATVNHMFKHTEARTLDLKNKPLSRYIIAEKLTSEITNGLAINGAAATYQFAGAYAPVANFSTRDVEVSFPVQADVMAKFVYSNSCGFSWAIGYDFWAQACPKVELGCNDDCKPTPFPENTWALRGDAHVYGFGYGTGPTLLHVQPIPATYAATTAFNIGKAFEGTNGNSLDNSGVNAAATPVSVTGPVTPSASLQVANNDFASPDIFASTTPQFIKESDLDICGVTRGMSNSIFTEFNWTWADRDCWMPYLGIGARVEFGSNSEGINPAAVTTTVTTNQPNDCCNGCGTCSVSVWGVWIKGGVSY